MTKGEAWEIVAGLVDNIDADEMAQLIMRLDDMLNGQSVLREQSKDNQILKGEQR